MMLFALVMLGCVKQPTGFVIGLDEPPGVFTQPGQILSVAPSQLIFDTTTDQKVITVLVKDPFVYKEVYLCSAPCKDISHWTKLGDLQGTSLSGNYLSGAAGLRQDFPLLRSKLNTGNNFIAVFTCKGVGLCNNMKWVKQKFRVEFSRCVTDDECTGNKKKCDTRWGNCVKCLTNNDCTVPGRRVCHPAAKECVECASDGDCSPMKCQVSSGGLGNKCVCYSTSDCSSGLQCSNSLCTVIPKPSCTITPSSSSVKRGGRVTLTVFCYDANNNPTTCPGINVRVDPSIMLVMGGPPLAQYQPSGSSSINVEYQAPLIDLSPQGSRLVTITLFSPSQNFGCGATITVLQ